MDTWLYPCTQTHTQELIQGMSSSPHSPAVHLKNQLRPLYPENSFEK